MTGVLAATPRRMLLGLAVAILLTAAVLALMAITGQVHSVAGVTWGSHPDTWVHATVFRTWVHA